MSQNTNLSSLVVPIAAVGGFIVTAFTAGAAYTTIVNRLDAIEQLVEEQTDTTWTKAQERSLCLEHRIALGDLVEEWPCPQT